MSFQRLKTWKQSHGPAFEAKKNRILHLYGLMDGTADVQPGDPDMVICVDEFGPLNLQPHPGWHWTRRAGGGSSPRRRRWATYTRPHGVRHLLAAYDLNRDRLYSHIKPASAAVSSWSSCATCAPCTRHDQDRDRAGQLQPAPVHPRRPRVGDWAAANNVELAYTPTNARWLNRIEAQLTVLRCFTLDGTDQGSHREQASMIWRYISWRNRHAGDRRLGRIVMRANVCLTQHEQAAQPTTLLNHLAPT